MSFRRVLSSSVGSKLLIGVTGLLLFAYLVLHLAGNLLVFAGQDTFNHYAHALISNPLVIPVEIALLVVFALHIYKTVVMWRVGVSPALHKEPLNFQYVKPSQRSYK